jgi:valyl-tRNA synthetase
LEGLLDPVKEKARLEKEILAAETCRVRENAKLADPKMLEKAPPEKVAEWRKIEQGPPRRFCASGNRSNFSQLNQNAVLFR